MLVLDFVTCKSVSIDESTLHIEVLPHDARFIESIGGPIYFYLVCAESMSESPSKVFIETFPYPDEAFAYLDHLKNSSAETLHDVGDQSGGDTDASI